MITAGALAAALAAAAAARADGPIQERNDDQRQRIAQGVRSGQLTAGEAARLERREAALNREERAMRAANGGALTPGDRAVINGQQNALSGAIYRDKHNAAVQPPVTGRISARAENQQDRIAAGIASGRLTAGEAARLEGREAGLNHEVRAMRRANGGTLTPGDRAVVNRQQNTLSRGIYRLKHNAPHRP
jgi:hypothetical protein